MGIDLLALFLFVRHDGLQQADEVFVCRVIMLVERVEALGQIRSQRRGVVPLQRGVV